MTEPDRVPRFARPFVIVFIVAIIASAVCVWEPWPLTSFRLFSHVRTDQQIAWRATTVDAAGTELAYPLDDVGDGLRNFGFRMAEFVGADTARRQQICDTWLDEAPETVGRQPVEIRLYERTWLLSDRDDDGARPGSEQLEFVCRTGGVTVVG
jgi:hypothetical protein